MKTITAAAILFLSFASVSSFATAEKAESVQVLSTKRYIFYFKVDKSLVGGVAEIYTADNVQVGTEKIEHVKNIVDFFYLAPGTYTVKIRKDDKEFSFTYVNVE
jgi:hypothetical protein